MAGARQNTSQEYVLNLSKKIEQLMDSATQYNEDTIRLLSSIDTIQKDSVSVELKKHTKSLTDIKTSINKWGELQYEILSSNQNKEEVKLFSSIDTFQKDSITELKEHTKTLTDIRSSINKWGELQYGVLINIEKKSSSNNAVTAAAGGGGGKLNSFIEAAAKLPDILWRMVKILAFAGLFSDLIVEGAASIKDSILEILSFAKDMSLSDALISVGMIRLLAESKITDVIDMLSTAMAPLIGLDVLTSSFFFYKSLELIYSLSKSIDPKHAAFSFLYYEAIARSKFDEAVNKIRTIEGFKMSHLFSSGIFVLSSAVLLSLSYMLDPMAAIQSLGYYELIGRSKIDIASEKIKNSIKDVGFLFPFRALALSLSSRILLNMGEGISITTALKSIGFFKLLELANLDKFTQSLAVSIGLPIPGKLVRRSRSIVRAARTLLNLADQKISKDNPNPVDDVTALKSIGFMFLLTKFANLDKFVLALTTSIGLPIPGKLARRARSIVTSARILLSLAKGVNDTIALKSVGFIALLSSAKIKELTEALSVSLGIRGLFDKRMLQKRALALREAAVILLGTADKVKSGTAIKSLIIFGILGLSLNMLVGALKGAAFGGIFIRLGVRVVSFAIRKLLGSMSEMTKSAKDMVGAGIFLFLLSSSITSIVLACTLAAVTAPLTLIGVKVLGVVIRGLSKFIQKAKNVGQQSSSSLDKILALLTIMEVFGTISDLMTKKIDAKNALKAVGIFALAILGIGTSVALVSKLFKSVDADLVDVLGASISTLIGAVTSLILSKALKNPGQSLKDILMFSLMSAIIAGNVLLFAKASKGLGSGKMIMILIFITGLILITNMVISFARGVGIQAVMDVLTFNIIVGLIVLGIVLISKYVKSNVGAVLKAVVSILLFVVGMIAVAMGVKYFISTISITDMLQAALIIAILGAAFWLVGKMSKQIYRGSLATAAMAFGLAFLTLGLLVFKAINFGFVDALVLGFTVAFLGLVFYLVGKGWVDIMKGTLAMALVGLSLAFLSIGLFFYKAVNIGGMQTLLLILTVLGLGFAFKYVGKKAMRVAKGAAAMIAVAVSVFILSFAMTVWKSANIDWKSIATLGATVGMLGLEYAAFGRKAMNVLKGAGAMMVAAVSVILLAVGMKLWASSKVKWKDIGILGATIAMLGLEMAAAGFGPAPAMIALGAGAMIVAGVAVILIATAMKIWTSAKAKWKDVGILGATIAMIALEMGGAGFASPMILLGAAAMTVSGVAVILIATAMKIFASGKVKRSDVRNLGYTIDTIADKMSSAGWSVISITAGSAAMIVAGAALLLIAKSVKIFADAKFKAKDASEMKKSIGILISAITMIGDEKALKELGIEINYTKMDKGIARMNMMVKILNSFLYWAKSWKKQKDINKTVDQIKAFTGSFIEIFDPQKNQTLDRSDKYLTSFANNISIMAKSADPLTKMAHNMERIQKAMKLFKESINGMDLKKLTLTDSMLHSMALLSKNPEVLAEKMRKSLETSFKELIKALKDLAGGQGSGSGTGTGGGGGNMATFGAGLDTSTIRRGAADSNVSQAIDTTALMSQAKIQGLGADKDQFKVMYLALMEALNDSVVTVRAAKG